MKKVLLTLFAVLMAVPAFAIEVYNNGEDTSVDIYGTIRGYVGYGHGSVDGTVKGDVNPDYDNFLYGFQGNSRIGTKFKVGNFSGQVELGANEKTMYNGKTDGTVGLRQAWGAYTFGNAGTFVAGKTDTPTTMSGFSSDIMDTDGGLKGYGGNGTGNRRFQMAYRVMGLDIALIEDEMSENAGNVTGFTDNANAYIPRLSIAYTYKGANLMAKIGATYSALNGQYTDVNAAAQKWTTIHAFGIVAGVKPTFMDGKLWLAVQARYGMNEDLYGESTTAYNMGGFAHSGKFSIPLGVNSDGTVNNTSRFNASVELGYKVSEAFSAIIGGGYQITMNEATGFENINSYAAYVQIPYTVSKNFSLVPQISYFGNSQGAWSSNAVLVAMQGRFTF